MAFEKKTWVNEVLQGNDVIYDIKKNGVAQQEDVTIELKNTVVQEGTKLNATNLNDLEDRIEEGFENASSMIVSPTAPTGKEGLLWVDTGTYTGYAVQKYWNGTAWVAIASVWS